MSGVCYTTGADSIRVFSDSQLVVSQLNGEYEAKDNTMVAYIRRVREATKLLKHFSITHITQSESPFEDEKPKRI